MLSTVDNTGAQAVLSSDSLITVNKTIKLDLVPQNKDLVMGLLIFSLFFVFFIDVCK